MWRLVVCCEGVGLGVSVVGMLEVIVLAFKVLINRTSRALGSEGAVLHLFIIQWLLYHTIKNERKYINQQHIYSESTNVFQLQDPKSFSRQL